MLAQHHVDRVVLGARIPAPALLALNSALVILLAPAVSWTWGWLSRRGLEPSTPAKFALALLLLGTGFLVLGDGVGRGAISGQVALAWLGLFYLLLTLGELCLSPVGLAMVTELAPRGSGSLCMGAWFMTYAAGHLVAGWIAGTTAASGAPGVESTAVALTRYAEVFMRVGMAALALGVVLVVLRRWVQRMIDPATMP